MVPIVRIIRPFSTCWFSARLKKNFESFSHPRVELVHSKRFTAVCPSFEVFSGKKKRAIHATIIE